MKNVEINFNGEIARVDFKKTPLSAEEIKELEALSKRDNLTTLKVGIPYGGFPNGAPSFSFLSGVRAVEIGFSYLGSLIVDDQKKLFSELAKNEWVLNLDLRSSNLSGKESAAILADFVRDTKVKVNVDGNHLTGISRTLGARPLPLPRGSLATLVDLENQLPVAQAEKPSPAAKAEQAAKLDPTSLEYAK